jgi:uncharacterized membrane protein YfhO
MRIFYNILLYLPVALFNTVNDVPILQGILLMSMAVIYNVLGFIEGKNTK